MVVTNRHQKGTLSSGSGLSAPPPVGEASILHILLGGRLLLPLATLLLALVGGVVTAVLLYMKPERSGELFPWLLALLCLALITALVGAVRLRSQLLKPLVRLEQSVAKVCQGDPLNTLPFEHVGVLGSVVRDFDSLSGELTEIYADMEERVDHQTRRLSQQTASLQILYDVAASINQVGDLDALLIRFLRILHDLVRARSASVYLVIAEGRTRLVGSIGLDGEFVSGREQLPLPLCGCGRSISRGDILCEDESGCCTEVVEHTMFSAAEVGCIEVPLEYQGERLGCYYLYVDRERVDGSKELLDLLMAIGSHLGVAIARRNLDEESRRLSIIEERTTLAHELHDSLAQTLASLRFQIRMLEDTLDKKVVSAEVNSDLQRISSGIDEAHTELRELLNSFLAPVGQQGLEPELKKLVRRFRQESGIHILLQRDCANIELDAGEEKQILRIIQECLANIRKHAKAKNVRILISCVDETEYLFLVEDDGVGFGEAAMSGAPGEHVGLSIMEERARRLGGKLSIESEPGEGTRVELVYNPQEHRVDDGRLRERF